jgi:type IV secretion system protein VirB10
MDAPDATPEIPRKVAPESVALRAPPQPVTRLNRRMLIVMAGSLAAAVLVATMWSLRPAHQKPKTESAELYNVDRVSRAESLEKLPQDYSRLPQKPAELPPPILGEPLPGDLGPAILHARGGSPAGADGYDAAQGQRQARQQDAVEAARSAVFFRSSGAQRAAAAQTASSAPPTLPSSNQPFDPMTAGPASAAQAPIDPTAIQNRQDQKEGFLAKAGDSATRNPGSLQTPPSPYQVMAGTIIPAAMVTGINSDLPGQVIATVTEAVYDTASGRYLLIPQGSRLIGRYDSQVAFGQRRVLLVWTRLILPDASSIALDKLPGIDPAGYAGLEDGVDWHWDRILAGAALSTLMGVGAELAAPENSTDGDRVVVAGRQSAQDTVNQIGQEITKRNLSVQPTLTIRPGFPMRVMVNKDLVLRPYQPLFFQRGALP